MNTKLFLCVFFYTIVSHHGFAQKPTDHHRAEQRLQNLFMTYSPKHQDFVRQPRIQKLTIDDARQAITIEMDSYFAQQAFEAKEVKKLYRKIQRVLPGSLDDYKVKVITNGTAIEELVPGYTLDRGRRAWGKIEYKGHPWVENMSKPQIPSHGLHNRHVAVWASHGRYYDNAKGVWKWQRPFLFATTEDLFTRTIVMPYLVPMLENAGATVFMPQERDPQTDEIIVDQDGGQGQILQENGKHEWVQALSPGFALHAGSYGLGENPFVQGTAQINTTVKKRKDAGRLTYIPNIQKGGRYAVYVSYQTLEESTSDAQYTVYHKGEATTFSVNQQMGGGTWVYLGTFDFDAGQSMQNCVVLTNLSKQKGVITADAVRFGGGMGNIQRGGSTSELPRFLEGARYYAQWAGAPYKVYSSKNGVDDYADDINVRSLMTNWLGGGSCYMPALYGQKVPIELSLAVHSDAGYSTDLKSIVGSLAICTTNFNDGKLNSGISRQSSKELAAALLNGIMRDIPAKYGRWNRRYLWDRNYSETRLPEVPSAIIETMSHQNFPDMMLGQDPNFKFDFARSLYKTILKYICEQHGQAAVVTPLQPTGVYVSQEKGKAVLRWAAQEDPQEPTAVPTSYNIYVARGNGGFDNGTNVKTNRYELPLQPGVLYSFKVTAVNRGGESFPTEIVSTLYEPESRHTVLIVNGFDRLSAPTTVNGGFDLNDDMGVAAGLATGWSGRQIVFDTKRVGIETESGLGYSGNELAGQFVMGNTFDYIRSHAQDIAAARRYNIVSASRQAFESASFDVSRYAAVDLILGLQKYSPQAVKYYKTFTPEMKKKLSAYIANGGRLLASGAYIGSDMNSPEDTRWMESTLHCTFGGRQRTDTVNTLYGMNTPFAIIAQPNPVHYAATHTDVLQPSGTAYSTIRYGNNTSAAVAYGGREGRTFVMGFPFETIENRQTREGFMKAILDFLLH